VFGEGLHPQNDVDHAKTIDVVIPVVCEAVPKRVEDPKRFEIEAPLELLSADLSVSHANYHGACPVDVVASWWATTNVSGELEAHIQEPRQIREDHLQDQKQNVNGTWTRSFDWKLESSGRVATGCAIKRAGRRRSESCHHVKCVVKANLCLHLPQ
jgi:hypothetical protein